MKSAPTGLALTLLLGLLWPVAAAAAIAVTMVELHQPLAWALLALVIVVTLIRPLPLADIIASIAATVVFVLALGAELVIEDEPLRSISASEVAVGAAVLLLTPWALRLLVEELDRLLDQMDTQQRQIDDLTVREESGAYRGRFLASILDEEIGRARRYRRSLMIGVVASDSWSELAEERSPAEMQALARSVEEHLLSAVRPVDKVISLGDGEWGLVLPETPLEGAAVVAARIQSSLAQETGLPIRIGLADFPRDAVTREGLVAEARQALAFARAAGLSVVDRTLLSEAG